VVKACRETATKREWVLTPGFTCATNMPPPGREVQAEGLGTLPAYRVRCKPSLDGARDDGGLYIAGAKATSRTSPPTTSQSSMPEAPL
jgi:hypothetical protein